MHRRVCLLLLLAACSQGSDPAGTRQGVEGLAFPTGLPQPTPLAAVPAFPQLTFTQPVFLTHPPDGTDRLFVVELDGLIRVFPNDPTATEAKIFLDLRDRVPRIYTSDGLLGLAFHPDYEINGYFYVYYLPGDPLRSRVSRFRVSADPDRADLASEEVFFEILQPDRIHNGGMLAFGPDGMLYVGVGDGGPQGDPESNGQRLDTLLGKILRLDPDGKAPATNPFTGVPGARSEIWAYGLRNPWRFSFDRQTGELWAGDVGLHRQEEIDRIERGGNYGWPVYEGDLEFENPAKLPPSAFEVPVWTYLHPISRAAVIGGYVYRGSKLPSLRGAYVFADFIHGRVTALVHDGTQAISATEVAQVPSPTSFGEDAAGELYVLSTNGRIYRFQEQVAAPETVPALLSKTGIFTNLAQLTPAPGLLEYEVNAPLWSDGATKRRWLALPGLARIDFHPTEAWVFPVGTVLVKHFELGSVRVETRVLVRHDIGWQGYTYRWNEEQTDATLLDESETATIAGQTWRFPSRTDCLACHTLAAGRVLGVRTRQINRDGQLQDWNELGLFLNDIGDNHEALPDPSDETAPVAARARAYLATNCSMCHRPQATTQSSMDLRYGTPTGKMNAVGAPATAVAPLIVDPGAKEMSALWLRIGSLDEIRMPPLGSKVVDPHAHALLGAWIDAGAE